MLTVRAASCTDRDLLSRLGSETYRDHFTAIWSPERLDSYIVEEYGRDVLAESLARPDRSQWLIAEVVEDGGLAAAGFAKLNWHRPLPAGAGPGPVGTELQKIYLLGGRTGRNIGAALLAEAIAAAAARDSGLLWLEVLKCNTRARAFYARHGFATVGEVPFATDRGEIGIWVMAREPGAHR